MNILFKLVWCLFKGFPIRTTLTCDIPYRHIPRSTEFPHPVGVVIGRRVKLGERCVIRQNVTIGTRWVFDGKEQHPILGNDVVVGAGAIIIGPIHIGDGARIAAGAIVLENVASGETYIKRGKR